MSTPADSPAFRALFVLITLAVVGGLAWGADWGWHQVQEQLAVPSPAPVTVVAIPPAPPPKHKEMTSEERLQAAYRFAREDVEKDLREAEEPVRAGGEVRAPTKLSGAEPGYTEAARRARVQGVVVLEVVVDREGRVTNPRVLKGLPLGLDEKARETVVQWRFAPATRNGEPVACYFVVTVPFRAA